ncbi:2Fe-2S iron-sulfur cluster binding domain-containing protein, partial [Candidatus Aerophobetes bacterium]
MMSDVSLSIDGRRVSVQKGTNILGAAKSIGVNIPHLCFEERLSPISACRLCLVEVEGMETLAAACSHPVAEGMIVKTNSARVKEARRVVLELILSDHPLDCLTCEKSGSCQLENYAYELEIPLSRFKGEKSHYPLDESNPFIERDPDK